MSTKIFNGYRLPHIDYPALLAATAELRPILRQFGRDTSDMWISRRATELIDGEAAGLRQEPIKSSPLQTAIGEFFELEKEAKTRRVPAVDMEASFTLLFHEGVFYALVFAENDEIRELLINGLEAEPMFYWNNSDRPKNMTEDEWHARAELWNQLVGRDAPNQRGPSFEFSAPTPSMNADRITSMQPDFKDRVKHVARLKLIGLRIEQNPDLMDAAKTGNSFAEISRAIRQVDMSLASDPMQEDVLQVVQQVRGTLKPRLEKTDFLPMDTKTC